MNLSIKYPYFQKNSFIKFIFQNDDTENFKYLFTFLKTYYREGIYEDYFQILSKRFEYNGYVKYCYIIMSFEGELQWGDYDVLPVFDSDHIYYTIYDCRSGKVDRLLKNGKIDPTYEPKKLNFD
jgi:hypothetical protein